MSTPCGSHEPISAVAISKRVEEWHQRVKPAEIRLADYRESMAEAETGDLTHGDPPYSHAQSILYGAQEFGLSDQMATISECKQRGVYVALGIDGTKRSGDLFCKLDIPAGLFEREVMVNCGRSNVAAVSTTSPHAGIGGSM
jgi:DNA adenine methylase